jgi:hypothetical protein
VVTAPGGNRAFALDLLGIHITEPDVALTDLALTIECLAIVGWLAVKARAILSPLKLWFLVFYLSIAVAALFGAIIHGFFSGQMGGMHDRLWAGTLVALGANALACWNLSARLMAVGARTEKIVQGATVAAFLGYCFYVVSAFRKFLVAVIAYLPATLFLLGVVIKLHLKEKSSMTMIAVVALIMTLVAAAVQQLKISIHPVYFDYNALYHVIQGIALLIFARFALWAITNDKGVEG